jgi:hypothetical protein
VGVVSHEVITPSIGVYVPVDVGVVELSINVAAVNVPSVHVAPVDIPCVHVAPVYVASIDVTGGSISDRRPPTSSTASRDAGLRYRQRHAARNQNCQNYNNPAHGSLSILKKISFFQFTPLGDCNLRSWRINCDI